MKTLPIAVLIVVALCSSTAAQEAPSAPQETTRSAIELVAGTLGKDIDTASFYELTAWCRSLGLAESGSRRELQERLRNHYGLPASGEPAAPGRTVTVRSARSAEYFTVEQADENYLVLSGDVVVELRDAEAGATHTIRAGRLTYNQARRTLAAGGGVQYTLEEGGRTETFEGRSLTLDLDTWEAAFIDGRTSKTQSRGDAKITFTFEGASITRLSGDQVVLEEGAFTSCDLVDPHYAIRARKVWILAAGEWALRSAVLTIGRVPVLWIPYFFYPGDRLVFNPSFGFRQREGAFVQTTTYLLGRRKEEESPFSFLKVAEAQGTVYDQELRGIFLRKLPAKAPAASADNSTLKLMVDAYSRLGVFVGLAGDFPQDASFMGGIAFGRTIIYDGFTGLYSSVDTPWNSSILFGMPVPFRFGFKGDAQASRPAWSGSLHFELFSDPAFTSDFYGRSEGFRLSETLEPVEVTTAAQTTSLTWQITNRFDLAKLVTIPGVTTLSVPYLNGQFSWLSRALGSDPNEFFYYPSSITAPSASLTVSGDLLRLGGAARPATSGTAATRAEKRTGPGKGFRDPFTTAAAPAVPATPAAAAAAGRLDLRRPAPRPSATPASVPTGPSLAITYQATPKVELAHKFDTANWDAPSDIDMGILYGTFEPGGTGRVQAVGTLLDNRLDLSFSLGFDSRWLLRFNRSASLPDLTWFNYLRGDAKQDRLDFTSTIGAAMRPFGELSAFAGSTVTWQLGVRLAQLRWDEDVDYPEFEPLPRFETRTLDLTKDTVSAHSLQATVPFRASGATGTFTLAAKLPVLTPPWPDTTVTDSTLTARLDASAWILKARAQAEGKWSWWRVSEDETESTWTPQPLVVGLSAEPWKGVSLSEELQASLSGDGLQRSTTQLRAGGFLASFAAEQLTPVDILTGLPSGPKAFLPSTVKLAFEDETGPLWSWKDRVKVEAGLRAGWSMNVQRYTDNLFEFAPRLTLAVHEALDLTLSSLSVNNKTYRYIPGLAAAVGETLDRELMNPISDLAWSFDFFNPDHRKHSAFKIRSISLKAVHHLHDWDLSFEYTGAPKLVTSPVKQYEWSPTFSIQLQWIPVPQLKAAVRGDRDEAGNDRIYIRE